MIFYQVLDCDNLGWPEVWLSSTHLLVWVVYCLMLAHYELAVLVPC